MAVQQLKGRAAGGATFEAMPKSAGKMDATLVKLSSFDAAIAPGSCWWGTFEWGKIRGVGGRRFCSAFVAVRPRLRFR